MGKILINGSFLKRRFTGVQRYAYEISLRLIQKPEVWIASAQSNPGGISPEKIWHVPPSGWARLGGSKVWSQLDLVRAVGSDLLWSPENIGPLGVKRHVITVHDLAALDHPQWFHPAFVALYCLYLPRLVHQVERILTVSEYSRCRLLDRFSIAADRVTVIPCGIAQSFQPCSAPIVQQMKERYGITTPYVLSLGSLDPRKNLRTLLQAWKLLGKDLQQSLTLVIAGDKNRIFADPGYQDRLHNLTGVIFTGYFPEPDLPALYSGALCLVYPSLYEGFGLPPLEAMACGTTVITSETTSLPEVVGDAGILIDPTQPEAIAAAIQLLVQNPAYGHELRQNGLIQAQRFSWDRSAAAVDQVLRGI